MIGPWLYCHSFIRSTQVTQVECYLLRKLSMKPNLQNMKQIMGLVIYYKFYTLSLGELHHFSSLCFFAKRDSTTNWVCLHNKALRSLSRNHALNRENTPLMDQKTTPSKNECECIDASISFCKCRWLLPLRCHNGINRSGWKIPNDHQYGHLLHTDESGLARDLLTTFDTSPRFTNVLTVPTDRTRIEAIFWTDQVTQELYLFVSDTPRSASWRRHHTSWTPWNHNGPWARALPYDLPCFKESNSFFASSSLD